jgi:hypothetical protein
MATRLPRGHPELRPAAPRTATVGWATLASLASAPQEGAADGSGRVSWLLVLEGGLAFPAGRDGDGSLLKEGQGGLAGIIKANEMALWGRRELPAQQERMPAAQRWVADHVVELIIAQVGEDVEPLGTTSDIEPTALVFEDQVRRAVATEPTKGAVERFR